MDVSVVVPVYKVEQYIERCARSLFEQTKKEGIEFIFVDDCSPDRSIEVLKGVLEEYPQRKEQVKIVRHTENRGLPAARESGVLVSTGKYVAHCDSDDWVEHDMYETMFNVAEAQGADLVFCDMNVDDGSSIVRYYTKGKLQFSQQKLIREMLLGNVYPGIPRILGKRSTYEGIDFPQSNFAEDYATVLQLVVNSSSFAYVDKAFYNYFFNPSSITKAASGEVKWRNYRGFSRNIRQIESIISNRFGHEYDNELFFMKVKAMTQVAPYVHGKSLRREWREVFPEVGVVGVFSNHCIGWRKKSIWLFTMFGIYSSLKGMGQRRSNE